MKRTLIFSFGVVAYNLGMASLALFAAYLIGYPPGFGIDLKRDVSLIWALCVDALLIGVFAVQHSVMARPAFKRWLAKFLPTEMERSVYVLASALALVALVLLWEPLGGTVWDLRGSVAGTMLYVLHALGWLTVVSSTFFIDHFDLFGLRQVYLQLRGRAYTHLKFSLPGPYKIIRHPLYVGWFTVFWAAPLMSVSHLLLAAGLTAYILYAVRLEERDLVDIHGEHYRQYQERVPRFFPALVRTLSPHEDRRCLKSHNAW